MKINSQFFTRLLCIFSLVLILDSCQEEQFQSPLQEADNQFVSEEINDKYIVVLNAEAIGYPADYMDRSKSELADFIFGKAELLLQKYGDLDAISSIDYVYTHSIIGYAGGMSAEAARKMESDPQVKYIEKDVMIGLAKPDGKGKPGNDGGQPAETTPWGITRVNVDGTAYAGSGLAWIIDSGIDSDHPDLNVNTSKGYNAFSSGKDGKSTDDGNGHGTHVSGTIGAIDNTIGVVGVAAGVTVVPVKVLSSRGSGSISGVIAGVDHVAENGTSGDVANMSLGGSALTSLDDAVKAAASGSGVIFCVAAGNDASHAGSYSPARANGTNVYTISAFDSNDKLASFSNYGNPPIDYSAPGVGILSCYKGGGYATLNGTSMACPHAAGVFLFGSNPNTDGTITGDKDNTPDDIIVK